MARPIPAGEAAAGSEKGCQEEGASGGNLHRAVNLRPETHSRPRPALTGDTTALRVAHSEHSLQHSRQKGHPGTSCSAARCPSGEHGRFPGPAPGPQCVSVGGVVPHPVTFSRMIPFSSFAHKLLSEIILPVYLFSVFPVLVHVPMEEKQPAGSSTLLIEGA